MPGTKRVAIILTNAPGKAARIGNAVGLDSPASLIKFFDAMRVAGYRVEGVPPTGDELIHTLIDRCSYDETILTTEQLAELAMVARGTMYKRMGKARKAVDDRPRPPSAQTADPHNASYRYAEVRPWLLYAWPRRADRFPESFDEVRQMLRENDAAGMT